MRCGITVRTVLRWDGTNGGTMFSWDAWYSKISRLAFDGGGRAGTALLCGPRPQVGEPPHVANKLGMHWANLGPSCLGPLTMAGRSDCRL